MKNKEVTGKCGKLHQGFLRSTFCQINRSLDEKTNFLNRGNIADLINCSLNSKHISDCGNEGDSCGNSKGVAEQAGGAGCSFFSFFFTVNAVLSGCWRGYSRCSAGSLDSHLPLTVPSSVPTWIRSVCTQQIWEQYKAGGVGAEGRMVLRDDQDKLNRTKYKIV